MSRAAPCGVNTAIAARTGRRIDLGVTIVRIAPAAAFEQFVRGSDVSEGTRTGQTAARVNHAASELAHVYGLSARVLARTRAMTASNASHKQYARAVIILQIVDIGLKALGIADVNASTCTHFGFDDTALIAVRVKGWMEGGDNRIFGVRLAS